MITHVALGKKNLQYVSQALVSENDAGGKLYLFYLKMSEK